MARRSRSYIVPEARRGMEQFKADVMRKEGYAVDPRSPGSVKFQVADRLGVPLKHGYNGDLTSASAGKIGGQIGGAMVREMVRLAQEHVATQSRY